MGDIISGRGEKMSRYYRSRRQSGKIKILILSLLLVVGVGLGIKYYKPGDIVRKVSDESIVKSKPLNLPIKEIEAPKSKIKAYWFNDNTNPIISISFIFKNAGYAGEDLKKQGISKLVAALLVEGAGDFTADELKEELEMRAITIAFNSGKDDFEGELLTTKDNLDKAVYFLRLMLTEPKFEIDGVKRVKLQMLEALKRQKEQSANELRLIFAQELYGNHPYARNPLGKKEDIENISVGDLKSFVNNSFSKSNLVIGIAGDISESEARTLIDDVFGRLPDTGKINFVRKADIKFDGRLRRVERDSSQNIWLAALPSVDRKHADFYPLFVANYVWGGAGLTSKLSQNIRENEGLTYGIYSYQLLDDKAPLLMVSFSATKDNFDKAKKIWESETRKFNKNGISDKELQKAKDYLISSYNLRFASIVNIAKILSSMQKYNLGLDFLQKRNEYISNISIKEVNNVIKKYINPQNTVEAEIGKF